MQAFTAEKTELLATYGADANRARTPSPDASRTHC